ncbi:MAG: YHS domain protein [Deltaproteobacteria bacterium]
MKGVLVGLSFTLFTLTGGAGIASGMASMDDPAIRGYDAVAYFKDGRALKGNPSFTFKWHGMTWNFLSAENRDLFAASPEQYAPQYDGYCSWAMAGDRKADTDPEVWQIVNGKLYLNCSRSAHEKWRQDIPGNIAKADANWKKRSGGN